MLRGTAPTECSALSLHDALPICGTRARRGTPGGRAVLWTGSAARTTTCEHGQHELPAADLPGSGGALCLRSEEHTSELQSRGHLVCRLLLEKKKRRDRTRKSNNE